MRRLASSSVQPSKRTSCRLRAGQHRARHPAALGTPRAATRLRAHEARRGRSPRTHVGGEQRVEGHAAPSSAAQRPTRAVEAPRVLTDEVGRRVADHSSLRPARHVEVDLVGHGGQRLRSRRHRRNVSSPTHGHHGDSRRQPRCLHRPRWRRTRPAARARHRLLRRRVGTDGRTTRWDSYRVVTFDERGHGASGPAPDGVYHWDGFATDALAVDRRTGPRASLRRRPLVRRRAAAARRDAPTRARSARSGRSSRSSSRSTRPMTAPTPNNNRLSAGARKRRAVFASREEARANYASKPPLNVLDPRVLDGYIACGLRDLPDGTVALAVRTRERSAHLRDGRIARRVRPPRRGDVPGRARVRRDHRRHRARRAAAAGGATAERRPPTCGRARPLRLPGRPGADRRVDRRRVRPGLIHLRRPTSSRLSRSRSPPAAQAVTAIGFSLVAVPFVTVAVGAGGRGADRQPARRRAEPRDAARRASRSAVARRAATLFVPAAIVIPFVAIGVRHLSGDALSIIAGVDDRRVVRDPGDRAARPEPGAAAAAPSSPARLAGAGNVATGVGGPFAAMYAINAEWPASAYRPTMQAFFLGINIVSVAVAWRSRRPTDRCCLPAMVVGGALGWAIGRTYRGHASTTNSCATSRWRWPPPAALVAHHSRRRLSRLRDFVTPQAYGRSSEFGTAHRTVAVEGGELHPLRPGVPLLGDRPHLRAAVDPHHEGHDRAPLPRAAVLRLPRRRAHAAKSRSPRFRCVRAEYAEHPEYVELQHVGRRRGGVLGRRARARAQPVPARRPERRQDPRHRVAPRGRHRRRHVARRHRPARTRARRRARRHRLQDRRRRRRCSTRVGASPACTSIRSCARPRSAAAPTAFSCCTCASPKRSSPCRPISRHAGLQMRAKAVWKAIETACERDDFRPQQGPLCSWCSFQQWCPAFGGNPADAPAP